MTTTGDENYNTALPRQLSRRGVNSALKALLTPFHNSGAHIPDYNTSIALWKEVRNIYNFIALDGMSFMVVFPTMTQNSGIRFFVRDPALGIYALADTIAADNILAANYSLARVWNSGIKIVAQTTPGGGTQGTLTAALVGAVPVDPGADIFHLNASTLTAQCLNPSALISSIPAVMGIIGTGPPSQDLRYRPQRTKLFNPVDALLESHAISESYVAGPPPAVSDGFNYTLIPAADVVIYDSALATLSIAPNELGPIRIAGMVTVVLTVPVLGEVVGIRIAVTRRRSNFLAGTTASLLDTRTSFQLVSTADLLQTQMQFSFSSYDDPSTYNLVGAKTVGGAVERVLISFFRAGGGLAVPAFTNRRSNQVTITSEEGSFSLEGINNFIAIGDNLATGQAVTISIVRGYEAQPDAALASQLGVSTSPPDDGRDAAEVEQVMFNADKLGIRSLYDLSTYEAMIANGHFDRILSEQVGKQFAAASIFDILKYGRQKLPGVLKQVGSDLNEPLFDIAGDVLDRTATRFGAASRPGAAASRPGAAASRRLYLAADPSLSSTARAHAEEGEQVTVYYAADPVANPDQEAHTLAQLDRMSMTQWKEFIQELLQSAAVPELRQNLCRYLQAQAKETTEMLFRFAPPQRGVPAALAREAPATPTHALPNLVGQMMTPAEAVTNALIQ